MSVFGTAAIKTTTRSSKSDGEALMRYSKSREVLSMSADLTQVPGLLAQSRARLVRSSAFVGEWRLAPITLAGINGLVLMTYAWALSAFELSAVSVPALLAIYGASMLSSIAGFAFSAICGALLFHLLSDPPVVIVQIMIVCSITIQLLSVLVLRDALNWRALPPFLVGGVLSIPAGVFLLLHIHQRAYAIVMGLALFFYGTFMLYRRPIKIDWGGAWADGAAGLLGGITGGFAGFPGALVTIWCGMKGWDKSRQRGVYQPFILIMQTLTLAVIYFMRGAGAGAGAGLDSTAYFYVPAALLGTWCGLAFFRRLSNRQFTTVVNLLLIASGLGLAV